MPAKPPPILKIIQQAYPNPFRYSPPATTTDPSARVTELHFSQSWDLYRRTVSDVVPGCVTVENARAVRPGSTSGPLRLPSGLRKTRST